MKSNKGYIYLIRHCHVESDFMLGQLDLSLSAQGQKCAEELAYKMADVKLDQVFSSPLKRCLQTATSIIEKNKELRKNCNAESGTQKNPIIVPDLREISLGTWEGLKSSEISARYPELWALRGMDFSRTAPPGGESYSDLEKRVMPLFKKLCLKEAENKNIAIVAHRSVNQSILAHFTNISLKEAAYIKVDYGSIKLFRLKKGKIYIPENFE